MIKGWEINGRTREILGLKWVDVDVLLVNTIDNTVFIKGRLVFKGRLIDINDEAAVTEKLLEAEKEILEIPPIEYVRWEITGWRTEESKWIKL